MAGSPKKATKKKAPKAKATKAKAKAKADKPKKPLSGYMKFVKGAYVRVFLKLVDGRKSQWLILHPYLWPAIVLMPIFNECKVSMNQSRCSVQRWHLGPQIRFSSTGHKKKMRSRQFGVFESCRRFVRARTSFEAVWL